ncbi:tRNA pseudouridine(38-40) synthase TruA [Winogradskyella sp. PC-19]|uniref:tRNA pseudouridine(38-40) synthase TruA n=1 Tax=unclassified Winogradskyella TaxID=2615021 RepID=UPI000B3CFE18|nr:MULTISPECIES: tRNA pseudouridine(38-40) synthase TruA [unclassified Winogradskyella]ARV09102.1 tRNA pseudouridine(38-40) synthase TruA [Winogradskyella sp. PC-19]RZN76605.1 MAG: tRNA pseudouridine(38-40) synthase TruA [Winogradskyella sp.]
MRYFIQLSYNGGAYHGWQIQPNAVTVQETIQEALSIVLNIQVSITGAGRTDTGVHASQMFAHFDVDKIIDTQNLTFKLNSFLPKDIAIQSIFRVNDDAHTRFHAVKRSYDYKISLKKNVFLFDYSHYMHQNLDVQKMNEAADILLEYQDFQCFSKSNTDVKTYNCKIEYAQWKQDNDMLIFTISADRFLRNMVRAIVGTLVTIGLGKAKVEDMHRIIASKDRSEAGFSVPAKGLYLTEVLYPESIQANNK